MSPRKRIAPVPKIIDEAYVPKTITETSHNYLQIQKYAKRIPAKPLNTYEIQPTSTSTKTLVCSVSIEVRPTLSFARTPKAPNQSITEAIK